MYIYFPVLPRNPAARHSMHLNQHHNFLLTLARSSFARCLLMCFLSMRTCLKLLPLEERGMISPSALRDQLLPLEGVDLDQRYALDLEAAPKLLILDADGTGQGPTSLGDAFESSSMYASLRKVTFRPSFSINKATFTFAYVLVS